LGSLSSSSGSEIGLFGGLSGEENGDIGEVRRGEVSQFLASMV